MNQEEIETINEMTAMAGDAPHRVNGRLLRRLSFESLGVLQMVGNPLAEAVRRALNGGEPTLPEMSALDLAVLVWAHAEDPDRVLQVALECSPVHPLPAREAALRFTRGWSLADIPLCTRAIMEDLTSDRAAAFRASAPETGGNDAGGVPKRAECPV